MNMLYDVVNNHYQQENATNCQRATNHFLLAVSPSDVVLRATVAAAAAVLGGRRVAGIGKGLAAVGAEGHAARVRHLKEGEEVR